MGNDELKILKALANVDDGCGHSAHRLAAECGLRFDEVRELLDKLKTEGLVHRNGAGMADVAAITWSGREALKGRLRGAGSINVHGGAVQIGSRNSQMFQDADDEDEEGDDADDDDYEEDGEGDYEGEDEDD